MLAERLSHRRVPKRHRSGRSEFNGAKLTGWEPLEGLKGFWNDASLNRIGSGFKRAD